MTRRCKSQRMTPRWTWFSHFLIVFAVERSLLGSLTTEHKEPSLYSQTIKAGPAQQNSDFFNSQWHRKIENAGQRWTKEYAWISIRKKREPKIQVNSNFEDLWVRLCDSLQFGSHFVISGHPPGTSQHFHSQGLMCLCSPCGRDNRCFTKKNRRERKKHAMRANLLQ